MFPEDQFCEWDAERKYIKDKVEVYAVFNQVPEFGKTMTINRPRKIRVKHQTTLNTILKHPEYVIPGIPVFYIVPVLGTYREEFLKIPIDSLRSGY